MIRELTGAGEVAAASGDDLMVVWAAQGMAPGVRVFASGEAVAVASPDLSRRDRLVVAGPLDEAVPLVRHALAEAGPTFRPIGEEPLVRGLAERVEGLEFATAFDWMEVTSPVPGDAGKARWLAEEDTAEVMALLAEANPDSYAVPGLPGVTRWAGGAPTTGRSPRSPPTPGARRERASSRAWRPPRPTAAVDTPPRCAASSSTHCWPSTAGWR